MITILIIVLLVILLFGGGYGYRTGYFAPGTQGNPLGFLLLIIIVVLVVALLLPHFGYRWY